MRTISVTGEGSASVRPDTVVLSMNIETRDLDYEKASDVSAEKLDKLKSALTGAGFGEDCLKTTSFHVNTIYNSVRKGNGTYENVFGGYSVRHDIKVEFAFDTKRLSEALSAISSSVAHPELSVRFTVEDTSAVNAEALKNAAANAKEKALILCEASDVKLGELMSISDNRSSGDYFSPTRYDVAEECCDNAVMMKSRAVDISPDDINISSAAFFVWEIR